MLIMKHIITILVLSFSLNLSAQDASKNLFPAKVYSPDLSAQAEKEVARQDELMAKYGNLTEKEEEELDKLLMKYGETFMDIWTIIKGGCNWYCAGGSYKVEASSNLSTQGANSYIAKSANDFSYKTAWVEGKEGDGIGEYLEYSFKNESPRITKVIISNGYMKSQSAWENNNRVKQLKMYVNGKEYAILNLKDERSDQFFEVGTLGRHADGTDLVLRFEIMSVYKGKKYADTALTEIYFDGIDDH